MPKNKNRQSKSEEVVATTQSEEALAAAEDTSAAPAEPSEQNAEAQEPSMQPEQRQRGITVSRPIPNNVVPQVVRPEREVPDRYHPIEMKNPAPGPGQPRFIQAMRSDRTGEVVLPAAVQARLDALQAQED